MIEKISPLTEKELRFIIGGYGLSDVQKNSIVAAFKGHGLLCKSPLQQKVEEAEKMWDDCCSHTKISKLEEIQHEAIQFLKEKHPEFGRK